MDQEETIPFDIENENEQLQSITQLRNRISKEEHEINVSESLNVEKVYRETQVNEFKGLKSTYGGNEQYLASQQLENENELLRENERLLKSRIETLEQIVEIQNDEIQKTLSPLASQTGPVPDLPPHLQRHSSSVPDLFYQLLKRWRTKVYELLIEKKAIETGLEKSKLKSTEAIEKSRKIEKEFQYTKRLKEQEIESTHLQLQIERRKNLLLKKQLNNSNEQERKLQAFSKHQIRTERQARKILETFFTSALPHHHHGHHKKRSGNKKKRGNNSAEQVFGFAYQNEKFERGVVQIIDTYRKRLDFMQNRVEMVKGIVKESVRTSRNKIESFRKENERLRENLLFRQNASQSGSRDSNIELIERLEEEVERLKRERNFLLTRKRRDGRDALIQVGDGLVDEPGQEGKVQRLQSCLKRAEQSIQSNLSVMVQLRKRFEEISSKKENNERTFRKSIKDLKEKLEIGKKKETVLYREILKKDDEITRLRKESLISKSNISNPFSGVNSNSSYRPHDKRGTQRGSLVMNPPKRVGDDHFRKFSRNKPISERSSVMKKKKKKKGRREIPLVQDSVMMKLNALNNITDQILSENLEDFEEDEDSLL